MLDPGVLGYPMGSLGLRARISGYLVLAAVSLDKNKSGVPCHITGCKDIHRAQQVCLITGVDAESQGKVCGRICILVHIPNQNVPHEILRQQQFFASSSYSSVISHRDAS